MAKIHIQFTLFSAFYSPLISTMTGNFLADEGFEYEWSVAEPGVSALEALTDGTAQVVQSTISQGFSSLENGQAPVARHFALINNMDGFFITGRDADSNFDWSSLEGAEVLVHHGGQPMTMFRYACHKAGIDISRINIIDAGNAKEMDAAFRNGRGKYIHQQGPAPQQLEADGVGHVVAALGPMVGACAFSSVAAMPDWLDSSDGEAFRRAYARTRHYMASTPAAEIASAQKPLFPSINESVLTQCIQAYQQMGCWPVDMAISEAGYNAMLDIFAFDEKITTRHAYESICYRGV
jgi:NitT/TauT family transport system substrate-binding protein